MVTTSSVEEQVDDQCTVGGMFRKDPFAPEEALKVANDWKRCEETGVIRLAKCVSDTCASDGLREKLEAVAGELRINSRVLRENFLLLLGFTLREYRDRCRVAKAKGLLEKVPFGEPFIARECGFGMSRFASIFRRYAGCLPSQYRRTHRKK